MKRSARDSNREKQKGRNKYRMNFLEPKDTGFQVPSTISDHKPLYQHEMMTALKIKDLQSLWRREKGVLKNMKNCSTSLKMKRNAN